MSSVPRTFQIPFSMGAQGAYRSLRPNACAPFPPAIRRAASALHSQFHQLAGLLVAHNAKSCAISVENTSALLLPAPPVMDSAAENLIRAGFRSGGSCGASTAGSPTTITTDFERTAGCSNANSIARDSATPAPECIETLRCECCSASAPSPPPHRYMHCRSRRQPSALC